jgi:urease accessory protein
VLDLIALMLTDSRTPTGSYAHSGGLEAALAGGLAPAEIPDFVAARLRTVAYVDAACAAAAARTTDAADLIHLEQEWLARTPAPALRRAARALGRALLRVCDGIGLSSPALTAWAAKTEHAPRCIALGAAAAAAGITPENAARLSLYDDAATVCAAAPKLVAVDALQAMGWLAAEAEPIARLARAAATATELPQLCTPGLDLLAQSHAVAPRRLFAS